jgi:hypothetical protein
VAVVHNLLKVASIRLAAFLQQQMTQKGWTENLAFLAQPFILGTYWTASCQILFL